MHLKNTVTDLINALPGNNSVNSPTHTRGQQYGGGVFRVIRARQQSASMNKLDGDHVVNPPEAFQQWELRFACADVTKGDGVLYWVCAECL
jgi:hypothetical protein